MLGLLARKSVILDGVVTVAAGIPPFARGTLHLDVAAVVFAAQVLLLFFLLLLRVLDLWPPPGTVAEPPDRRVGRGEVFLS